MLGPVSCVFLDTCDPHLTVNQEGDAVSRPCDSNVHLGCGIRDVPEVARREPLIALLVREYQHAIKRQAFGLAIIHRLVTSAGCTFVQSEYLWSVPVHI